jgi:LPXTG-site transpeptidase (sortase) family protein
MKSVSQNSRNRNRKVATTAIGGAIIAAGAVAGLAAFAPTDEPDARASAVYENARAVLAGAQPGLEATPSSVLDRLRPVDHTPGATAIETPSPTATPDGVWLDAPVARIAIARIGVDAEVVHLNLTPAGAMDVPDGPEQVGWYDFTAKPGHPGNAVLSGHVDYHNYGPAVFWDLHTLQAGDRIAVTLQDASVVEYEVTALQSYPVADMPMAVILAPTETPSLTLITCAGWFDSAVGEYTERLVVRAVQVNQVKAAG